MAEPESSEYLQINYGGVNHPAKHDFPPVDVRVSQAPDPYRETLADYHPSRTTLQESDSCQLRCPGCYAKPYLPHASDLLRADNGRAVAPHDTLIDQVLAHGPQLEEVYLLGLEPTLQPERSSHILADTRALGLKAVAATNAATTPERFDATFGEAVESGQLHRINISLDSIDPTIHNDLRGRAFAFERTSQTIKHAVEKGMPVQITTTVWADNYHTILDTVQELYKWGVRGFAFHEGSLEGAPDYQEAGVRRVEPYAWRALVSELENLKARYEDAGDLEHFVFPYIYFTEEELRSGVIGDDKLTDEYLEHVSALKQDQVSNMPFIACPGVDVPQVYVFSNDGPESQGTASLCNMHTIGSGAVLADFRESTSQFHVVQDPARNQIEQMRTSPYLCPALPFITRSENPTDETVTPEGSLYHACRYISSNQMPTEQMDFGGDAYKIIASYYRTRRHALENGVGLDTIDDIERSTQDFASRLQALEKRLSRTES